MSLEMIGEYEPRDNAFIDTSHFLWIRYPFPKQALVFTCLWYKSFENTVGKGENAGIYRDKSSFKQH